MPKKKVRKVVIPNFDTLDDMKAWLLNKEKQPSASVVDAVRAQVK